MLFAVNTRRRPGRPACRSLGSGVLAGAVGACLLAAGCHGHRQLPRPGSESYSAFIASFYAGLAALQVGDDEHAASTLAHAIALAPGEPAAWANWGVLALRQRNYGDAATRLNKAKQLAPGNDHVEYLLGVLASDQGNPDQAITDLRAAVQADPRNLWAAYRLAQETERQDAPGSAQQAEHLLQQIVTASPGNIAALVDLARLSARLGDAATLRRAVTGLAAQAGAWPQNAQQQLHVLQTTADGPAPQAAALQCIFLRNLLEPVPAFRRDLAAIKPPQGEDAIPFTHLVFMTTPPSRPDPADMALRFQLQPLAGIPGSGWQWAGAISLNGEGAPVPVAANAREVLLGNGASMPFPGGPGSIAPAPDGILPVDFNFDWKQDLVLAGAGGVRLWRQDAPTHFTDVTAAAKLPAAVTNAPYTGAWALDVEADGDLDVALGSAAGAPTVLRNNGDGTFTATHPFPGISGLTQLIWCDLDGDQLPDAAILDGSGRLHVFLNQRGGVFREATLPALTTLRTIAAGDIRHGNTLDLLALTGDGQLVRFADVDGHWTVTPTVRAGSVWTMGEVRLHVADLDNNGAADLLLTRTSGTGPAAAVWLQNPDSSFTPLSPLQKPSNIFTAIDLHNNGRLDVLSLSADGAAIDVVNHGSKNYHWQTIRPHAAQVLGDQRVNSFGIGGNIELRSGLLLQRQTIAGPQLHFGLGTHTGADVARIVWPNGSVRAEFDLKADQQIVAEQRLKGSCPFLFAWNGHTMAFVKDTAPWGAAIGLQIDGIGPARIATTREWFKIPGTALQPRNGYYDLRVTGELWESFYYDALSLMVVDHPAGTAVFTDERFDVPPVKLAVTAMAAPQPIAHAEDDRGHDVTATLHSLDGRYLDTFGRGQYQGITRDHFVELDLGPNVPASGPLWLVARGWIHPSDSTVNIAMSQGHHPLPEPLMLEVPDGHGGWRVARANLGFPAGRFKNCLIDLTGLFQPGMPHRIRLRTNLEIYWDQIEWAQGEPATPLHITRLSPSVADLRYRGFSAIHQANASSPEVPAYNQIASTTPEWRDLAGYYTRYGDVRPLLAAADDRYVLMNAGDELALRFKALPPPPAGWVRDFVFDGDGWVKDGDYNSTDSATLLPLPYHARTAYTTPPAPLEDEWVYRQHPEDWKTWQTRYVSPDTFDNALNTTGEETQR